MTNNFHELDVVELQCDLPENNLKKGDQGVIVAVFDKPEVAYEVEFTDGNGATVAQLAIKSNQLKKVQ